MWDLNERSWGTLKTITCYPSQSKKSKEIKEESKLMSNSIKLILGILLFISSIFSAPLDWRIYKNENSAWICSATEIQVFTPATRNLRSLTIDQTRLVNRLYDFVEYDGFLWVTSDAGVYKVDMNTMGAERIALPGDSIIDGHIAIDMDYMWIATTQTLFKYDQLGQEWLKYPLPEAIPVVNGVYSNGDEVFCVAGTKLYRFTVSTEKWDVFPNSKEVSLQSQLVPGSSSFKFIDGAYVRVYKPSSYSWDNISTGKNLVDYIDEDSVVYYCAGKNVCKLNAVNSAIRPFDIPGIDTVYAIEKLSDTVIVATGKRLIKFDTKSSGMDFIEYSTDLKSTELEKVIVQGNFIITVYSSSFAIYDKENRGWQIIPRSSLKKNIKHFSWDNDGMTARYAPGYQSFLRGSIEEGMVFKYKGYEYDTTVKIKLISGKVTRDTTFDSTRVFGYTIPKVPLMNLNLRTSDPNDRSLDLFINNTSLSTPAEKGLYYKGNRDDRLNNIRAGTTSNDQLSSMTLPEIQLEGVSAGLESKMRVEGRDRKLVKIAGGSGYITSRTEWRTLPYRSDGSYYLMKKRKDLTDSTTVDSTLSDAIDSTVADTALVKGNRDTLQIIPGTVRVWIDGELLDSTYYTFYSPTAKLLFTSNAPVDPASAITIQYKIQTIPDEGIDEVEFIPEHNFGMLDFGALTISPKEWISARVGFTGLSRDTARYSSGLREISPIVNVSTPLEFRNQTPNLFLKLNPEYSYNSKTGKQAGSASLQSRIGNRTGLILNGMFADKGYATTDTLSYGYGAMRKQYDGTISYDIKTELPLRYYQHYRDAQNGTESRYSAFAGAHFQGLPFFDVTLSRTSIDHRSLSDTTVTTFDSLWNTKDKLHLRLYERSSKFLEQLTHFKRISYDISHSEYRREFDVTDWLSGRLTTAEFTMAPISQIILTGNVYYRKDGNVKNLPTSSGRQSLDLQTIDAPKGVDFHAMYYMNYGKYSSGDSCTDTIARTIDVILKPGMWHSALKWFSPRFGLSKDLYCRFNVSKPNTSALITGSGAVKIGSSRKKVGINIFPSDAILFRNLNELTDVDTSEVFKTSNDLQIWSGTKNFWQAIWNYSTKNDQHYGSLSYDRIWTHWLRTAPGFSTDFVIDSLGSKQNYGPNLKINFNLQDVSFLKLLVNSHDFKLSWEKRNGMLKNSAGITYTFNISVVLLPNIQLNNFESIKYEENVLNDFQSRTSLIVNF
jgi:hypothetical protein